MAGELQRRGVDHLIIEQKSEPARLTKALGVSPRTLELFDRRPEPSRPDPRSDDGVIGQRAASRSQRLGEAAGVERLADRRDAMDRRRRERAHGVRTTAREERLARLVVVGGQRRRSASRAGSAGNGACGSVWYQYATDA